MPYVSGEAVQYVNTCSCVDDSPLFSARYGGQETLFFALAAAEEEEEGTNKAVREQRWPLSLEKKEQGKDDFVVEKRELNSLLLLLLGRAEFSTPGSC